MTDLHNHLLPGVDDGAADLEQSRAALDALTRRGVRNLTVTPHVQGSLTADPVALQGRLAEIDAAWSAFRALCHAAHPNLQASRGAEVMLDIPAPDLSDPRLRLNGTRFVLVEFPYMNVPPGSVEVVFQLKLAGWTPVIAHPERYAGLDADLEIVEAWRRSGALLQVNAGSLSRRYGEEARTAAWTILRRGWADLIATDYHARGRTWLESATQALAEAGAEEQLDLLTRENPERVLRDEVPAEVPPLPQRRRSLWHRLVGAAA
jgi:protein-tyrosine phosphatase